MENNEFISDKGLFIGQSDFKYSNSESFETIENYLKTIKEYRDYAHPNSPEWPTYIDEFFHVLGFQTEQKTPRLISLGDMGAKDAPKALVMIISPGDNFDETAQQLDWCSQLFFATNFYHVSWGIITNGLAMKVLDFRKTDYQTKYFWANLDGIIQEERMDSFFAIYKILALISGVKVPISTVPRPKKPDQKKASPSYRIFLEDVLERFTKKTPRITSINTLDV